VALPAPQGDEDIDARASVGGAMVDWSTADRVATWLADRRPVPPSYDARAVQREFDELVTEAEQLVIASTGLRPRSGAARAKVTDRAGWASVNVTSFQRILGPSLARLEERRSTLPLLRLKAVQDASRLASGAELGALLAWMSSRVLGQYDLLIGEEPTADQDLVYFVGPNVVELETRHGFPPREFRLWLALHEVTHRLQFTAVEWLKPYFLSLVDEGLQPLVADPRRMADSIRRAAAEMRAGKSPLAEVGVLGLVATPEQLQVVGRIQALMSLLEGHGDVTMDRAGASAVPGASRFSSVLKARREQVRGPAKLLQRLLGVEAKLRQYAQGECFIHAVEDAGGPELLAEVWRGPAFLPTLEEIREPQTWVARMGDMPPSTD
jgi:coenzyme F420 biosynthesis associated uncharacterized protein